MTLTRLNNDQTPNIPGYAGLRGLDLDGVKEHNPRVLVVDDDPDFINMAKLILTGAGFDVAGAADSKAALEKCAHLDPDLILLDLMMPGIDGFQAYEQLKAVTPAPVILITASGDRQEAARCLQVGMEDFISKPFHNAELVARLHAVLRRSKKVNERKIRRFPEIGMLVNYDLQEVTLGQKTIRLVPREFSVFKLLVDQAPRPVMYPVLTSGVWGQDTPKTRSHLKNVIFSIRRKIEEHPSSPKRLINYRSLGYRLMTQSEAVRA